MGIRADVSYIEVLGIEKSMCLEKEINDCYEGSDVVAGKRIFVFEKHNMALPVWGYVAHELNQKLNLITFDTHTDTIPPFSSYKLRYPIYGKLEIDKIKSNPKLYFGSQFCFNELFNVSKKYICNAEHIETAIELKHLQSFKVVYRRDEVEEFDFVKESYAQYFHYDKINWNDLYKTPSPLVLDFDLDYFHDIKEMGEEFVSKIRSLIERAEVITIALETDCFYETAVNGFSLEDAFEILCQIIKDILI